jgi:hypothetical protein
MQDKINAAKAKNESPAATAPMQTDSAAQSAPQATGAAAADPQKTNTMAILALVFAFIIPLVGFILALVAMSKIKKSNEGGKGLAIAGLIISIVLMITQIIAGILFTVGVINFGRSVDSATTTTTTTGTNNNSTSSSTTTNTSNYSADENKAITIVNSYLQAIKTENYQAAWNLLGPELQKEYAGGEADFAKELTDANLRLISTWNITNATTNEAGDRITLDGTATFKTSNPTGTIKFGFYKDNDGSLKMYLWDIRPS